jgi:hypothetical protein
MTEIVNPPTPYTQDGQPLPAFQMWVDDVSRYTSTATPLKRGGVKQAAAQADSAAASVADLVTDFNALLAKLRTAGILES